MDFKAIEVCDTIKVEACFVGSDSKKQHEDFIRELAECKKIIIFDKSGKPIPLKRILDGSASSDSWYVDYQGQRVIYDALEPVYEQVCRQKSLKEDRLVMFGFIGLALFLILVATIAFITVGFLVAISALVLAIGMIILVRRNAISIAKDEYVIWRTVILTLALGIATVVFFFFEGTIAVKLAAGVATGLLILAVNEHVILPQMRGDAKAKQTESFNLNGGRRVPTCASCSNQLSGGETRIGRFLFDGIVCQQCHKVECTACKGTPFHAPCKWCSGNVDPCYDNLF